MRRRLPLFSAPAAADGPPSNAARPRTHAIGIADTSGGEEALRFALALTAALCEHGARVQLALLAFAVSPQPTGAVAAALARSSAEVSLHAIAPEAARLPLAPAEDAFTLLVGVPALAAFDSALAVLLGVERALQHWPAGLRAHRERFDLALGTGRPGLARALAARLSPRDILPPGDQRVR